MYTKTAQDTCCQVSSAVPEWRGKEIVTLRKKGSEVAGLIQMVYRYILAHVNNYVRS